MRGKVCMSGKVYFRPDRRELVGVSTGLGPNGWIVCTCSASRGTHRVKSKKLPPTRTAEECQSYLDAYAAAKGWPTIEEVRRHCPGNGGHGEPCCPRAGEYNGFGSDGPLLFRCPVGCTCHD